MNYIARFGFSKRAVLAIDAAVSARSKHTGADHAWSDDEFANQLTRWLVAEGLMPVHVAPDDFRRFTSQHFR